MQKRELIKTMLEGMGYKPEEDKDSDLWIYYQMKPIYFIIGEEEEPFLAIVLPHFYEIDEDEETLVLATCNKMCREIRVGKVYVDHTFHYVSAAYEFCYTDEESLKQNIEKALYIMGIMRSLFRNYKKELGK